MAKPTKQQVEQAFIDKPDLGETFYHPASGGYAKPGKGDWSIYDWAERYGAQELPNIFGGAISQPTPIKPTPTQPSSISQPTPITPTPIQPTATPAGTVTKEDIRKAYTSYIGREPTEEEYTWHIGKTGYDDLNEWAMKQTWEGTPKAPIGTTVSAPVIFPEGTLVRAQGDTKVYAILPDGTRAHVPDSETFNKLYGSGAWSNIKTISSGELQGITEGEALSAEFIGAQEGAIRVNPQTGKREVFQNGIWNPTETFDAGTKDIVSSEDIVKDTKLSADDMRAIEEGELVSAEGRPEVYLAKDGILRHIPSPSEFEKMGYKWEDIRDVAPSLIEAFKTGTPITQLVQQIDQSVSTVQAIIDEAMEGSEVEALEGEQETTRKTIAEILKAIPEKLTAWWKDPSIATAKAAKDESQKKINALEAAKQTALNISKNRLESTAFISGEQEQIKDRMNIEIALEQATLAMLSDDFDTAKEEAQLAVELAIKQEELKLQTAQQALDFIESDLTREDKEVAQKIQFALVEYQAQLEQAKEDAANRANTYAQIIATYGVIPGLDPSLPVTEQWSLVGPQATQERNLRMAALQKQIDDTGTTGQTGVIPALEAANLGVPYGTTYEEYSTMSQPVDWVDDQFRVAFRRMITANKTYQEALDEISLDDSILNKDRGKFIAAEMWGQIEPGTDQAVFENKATPYEQTTLPKSASQTQLPESPGLGIFDDYKGIGSSDIINLYK